MNTFFNNLNFKKKYFWVTLGLGSVYFFFKLIRKLKIN